MSQSTKPVRRPQRNATKEGFANGYGNGYVMQQEELPELPANRVNLAKMEVNAMRKYAKQYEVAGVNPQTSSKEDLASAVSKHFNAWAITEENVLQNLLRGRGRH